MDGVTGWATMAMAGEALADPELEASVWGRVDIVACGDEAGTSPCGRSKVCFLDFPDNLPRIFETSPMVIAYSVLMAVQAGSGDLTMLTFARSAKTSVRLSYL
jgi:hypothetical protein